MPLAATEGGKVRIARQFVSVNGRTVHVRRGGRGPVLVAVHESPRSSRTQLPLIEALGHEYDVIAPDTPGFGLSQPLHGDRPTLDALADALAETLTAMGVERHRLYGTHTGAAIAIRYALRHRERVSALILDGVAVFTAEEREEFLTRYLQHWEPAWDGSHVMHLWSRSKDMRMWFPWQRREPATRLGADGVPPGIVHETVLGYLMAGPNYHRGYACATELTTEDLASLQVPATVFARPEDVLRGHGSRIPTTTYVRTVQIGAGDDAWLEAVRAAAARTEARDAAPARDDAEGPHRLLAVGNGLLRLWQHGPAAAKATVVLDDVPSCGDAFDAAFAARVSDGRVIVLSLPGCNGSDPIGGPVTVEASADAVRAALATLGLTRYTLVALGTSAALLGRLRTSPGCERAVAVRPPRWLVEHRPPVVTPLPQDWQPTHAGADFLASWFVLRDLWFYEDVNGDALALRTRAAAPDVSVLHRRFVRYWLSPESTTATLDRLRAAAGATTLAGVETVASLDDLRVATTAPAAPAG
jgi:pimeloyl-ACP methyl ester carboxylesterase